MEISVYFEENKTFEKTLKKYENKINLSEIMDNIVDGLGFSKSLLLFMKENTNEDGESKRVFDNLVITTEDCSGLNSHVLENIRQRLITIEKTMNIKSVILNNPPKFLINALRKIDGVEYARKEDFFNKPEKKQIQKLKDSFDNEIIGQKSAKKDILRNLIIQFMRKGTKPLVLMFYGKPGIGKTETAKFLSNILYGDNREIVREQMTMVGGEESVRYFKSAKHSEDSFSKKLLKRESNVILLDEFALVPDFFQSTFYQMFDEGVYADANFDVDVNNSIIICTSNLMSLKEIQQNLGTALYSRFDGFIYFKDFSNDEKLSIAHNNLRNVMQSSDISEYSRNLNYKDLERKLDAELEGLSNFRSIRKYVENLVANEIMERILD